MQVGRALGDETQWAELGYHVPAGQGLHRQHSSICSHVKCTGSWESN